MGSDQIEQNPPTFDEIKRAAEEHLGSIRRQLASSRKTKETLAAEIRRLVAEEHEAARIVTALNPKPRARK